MIDLLQSIPGKLFLSLFMIIGTIVIFLSRAIIQIDKTRKLPIPEPTKFAPWQIAYLQKGMKGAILTTTMELIKLEKLSTGRDRKTIKVKGKSLRNFSSATKIQEEIMKFFYDEGSYKSIFSTKNLKEIEQSLSKEIDELKNENLVPDKSITRYYWQVFFGAFLLVCVPSFIKLYLGIQNERPIIFLVLLLTVFIITLILVLKPSSRRTTALGKKFLEKAKVRFQWTKESHHKSNLPESDLIYAVALYGVSPLNGTELAAAIGDPDIFEKAANSTSGGGGCSGGCSGGGCGGGGCGGGCGGCG